jgi:hypothetical protein
MFLIVLVLVRLFVSSSRVVGWGKLMTNAMRYEEDVDHQVMIATVFFAEVSVAPL